MSHIGDCQGLAKRRDLFKEEIQALGDGGVKVVLFGDQWIDLPPQQAPRDLLEQDGRLGHESLWPVRPADGLLRVDPTAVDGLLQGGGPPEGRGGAFFDVLPPHLQFHLA